MPKGPTKRRGVTRARLLDSAAELFAERGFAAASIEDICEAAGYTRGAFYSNFANKDELFVALLQDRVGAQVAAAREAFADVTDENLPEAFAKLSALGSRQWFLISTEFTLFAIRNPEHAHELAKYEAELRDDIAALIADVLARTNRAPATSADDMARLAVALIDGARAQSYLEPELLPPGTLEARHLLPALLAMTLPRVADPQD